MLFCVVRSSNEKPGDHDDMMINNGVVVGLHTFLSGIREWKVLFINSQSVDWVGWECAKIRVY